MPKKLLINVDAEETRVAILDENRLTNLRIENTLSEQRKGNLYKARVQKIESSFQAAFLDYGARKHGFLPASDIHPRYYQNEEPEDIQQMLSVGQELIVQVAREEVGHKGATLTTFVSLPGRYLVLIPESDKTGVSRKLNDDERARLREIAEKTKVPPGFGLIVRTAGQEQTRTELNRDLNHLVRLWKSVEKRSKGVKAPHLLHHDQSLAIRFIRDYLTSEVKQIVVDDPDTFEEVVEFIGSIMPRKKGMVKLHEANIPLFAHYQLEKQIEAAFSREVRLPAGGSIVIDHTEALIAIDVNSGRVKEKAIEETAALTNLEAAREAARQIILRDLGGLIVIDFIDMREKKNVRNLEKEIKAVFKEDKARTRFSKISEFGMMEISRQRMGAMLEGGRYQTCPRCHGLGRVQASASAAIHVLRKVKELVVRHQAEELRVRLPYEVSNHLFNKYREDIVEFEVEQGCRIEILGTTDHVDPEDRIQVVKKRRSGNGEKSAVAKKKPSAGADDGEGRSKRDRNRRKKNKPKTDVASKPDEATLDPVLDPDEEPDGAAEPRRSRSARPDGVDGEEGGDKPEAGEKSEEPKKKRSRNRRRTRKKRNETKPTADEAESSQQAPVESGEEAAKPEKKPRRNRRRGGRGRRGGAKKAARGEQGEQPANTSQGAPESAGPPADQRPVPVEQPRPAALEQPRPTPLAAAPAPVAVVAAPAPTSSATPIGDPAPRGGFFRNLFRKKKGEEEE